VAAARLSRPAVVAAVAACEHDEAALRALLDAVKDPELPVISIEELGVLRGVAVDGDEVVVTITPTYSGCPAMATIEADIHAVLSAAGVRRLRVETVLSPAWTTDWMGEAAREKLRAYGIAPPQGLAEQGEAEQGQAQGCALFASEPPAVPCPRCRSADTRRLSEFGSTACKAQYQCRACLEPFDYFKCI